MLVWRCLTYRKITFSGRRGTASNLQVTSAKGSMLEKTTVRMMEAIIPLSTVSIQATCGLGDYLHTAGQENEKESYSFTDGDFQIYDRANG